MILFKRVEVDLEGERVRIAKARYNKRQRAALTKLVDLFEQGKFQACLDHINDGKAFPYNERGEYGEREHVGIEIGNTLRDMAHVEYYTQDEMLKQVEAKLAKMKAEARAKECQICHGSGRVMQATGNPNHPLKAVKCVCKKKGHK